MTAWLVTVIAVALLTAAQIIVHVREYGLLVWPPRRSARYVGRPRLPALLTWEIVYYQAVCAWLALSWAAWELPPAWLTFPLLLFSATHLFGFFSLRTERDQLDAAIGSVNRDSSISELAAMFERQYKAPRAVMAFSVIHDGVEVLVFGSVLFYLASLSMSS